MKIVLRPEIAQVGRLRLHSTDQMFQIPRLLDAHEFGFRFSPHRHVCGNRSMDTITETAALSAMESLLDGLP
jgi:hypothetical protein